MPTNVLSVTVEIKANMRVALDIQLKNDISGMKNVLSLNTVVEEILEDGYLLIHMPIYQGCYYPLPRDKLFLANFFVDSHMYFALPVQFHEQIQRGGFTLAKIRRFDKIKPHERRDCYRMPCSLPVTVERMWQSERVKHSKLQPAGGQIINFSDGGMLFATNENIENGEKITLIFDIGQIEFVEGMVLHTS